MKNDPDSEEDEKLKEEIERLRKENEELRELIEKIAREKKKIEKEYEEYRMRHPETVGIKNGKPYVVKENVQSSSPKRPGARKGHKPHYRKVPESIDGTVEVVVTHCPDCGGTNLSAEIQETRTRVIEDIPICNPVVTKYEIERRYCRDCKKLVESPIPTSLPRGRFGIRTMLLVAYMKLGLRMPVASVSQHLKDTFGIKISKGGICLILEQLARVFGPFYDQLVGEIRSAMARNMDETSWRIKGENAWLWIFITKYEAIYHITSSRGHDIPLELIGRDAKGTDIHDRFSAYSALAKKTKRPQQVCWSHIMCNAKELWKFHGDDGHRIYSILRSTYKRALAFDHQGTDMDIKELFISMKADLTRDPYRSHKCWKFVENLLKDKDSLFLFVKDPEVEPTNNRAERGLRHCVIARKISGGSKSPKGARIYEVLLSVCQTLKLRGQNLVLDGPVILQSSAG